MNKLVSVFTSVFKSRSLFSVVISKFHSCTMPTGKAWTLAKAYEGTPKVSDFKPVEEKVPDADSLKSGEILVQALYLSVDPYMRVAQVPVGSVLQGEQVARVLASKNPKYPKDSLVQFHHGWRTYAVISPEMKNDGAIGKLMLQKVPNLGTSPPSAALGVLGLTGLTAYFALEEKGKPKKGEVVMVSGAAGAVGSIAGQIAKIKGATVIGAAGTDAKVDKLVKEYGFHHAFNYKTQTVDEALKQYAPNGVDLYFDNVGGDFSWAVLQHMKDGGRAIICGSISTYNNQSKGTEHNLYEILTFKNMDFLGTFAWYYFDKFPQGVAALRKWIDKGDLKYAESVFDGFDKMPDAFISLFSSSNNGKVVVKV